MPTVLDKGLTEYDLEWSRIRSTGVRARVTWHRSYGEYPACDIAAHINHRHADSRPSLIARLFTVQFPVLFPGICPKCTSRSVTQMTDYGPTGTGPGGRARLGDNPHWPQPSRCESCGHTWNTQKCRTCGCQHGGTCP